MFMNGLWMLYRGNSSQLPPLMLIIVIMFTFPIERPIPDYPHTQSHVHIEDKVVLLLWFTYQ